MPSSAPPPPPPLAQGISNVGLTESKGVQYVSLNYIHLLILVTSHAFLQKYLHFLTVQTGKPEKHIRKTDEKKTYIIELVLTKAA